MSNIIFIICIILVRVSSDDKIILSDTIGGSGGTGFSFYNKVGPKYPKSITIYFGNRINRVGFTYYDYGFVYAGKNTGSAKSYEFKANEFINYMKICSVKKGSGYRVGYIYFKTNLNKELSCGSSTSTCKTFEPDNRYAIAGFHGRGADEIDSLGCIYHIFYYECSKLDQGQFCSYDQTEVLTSIPDGFFLNDTDKKTIDKCYSSCKKCTNYGNENNHNCDECISNYYQKIEDLKGFFDGNVNGYFLFDNYYHNCYSTCIHCYGFGNEINHNCSECISNNVFLDEPDFQLNCYEDCLNYIFNRKSYKYECTTQGFSLIYDTINKTKNEIFDNLDKIIEDKKPNKSYVLDGNNYSIFIGPLGRYLNESNVKIDFSECEKILKEKYPNFSFTLLQINSKNSNPNCLNEDIEYIIYNQFWERMDLSCCKNAKITIQNKILKALDFEKIKYFKNKGIDIFNLEEEFFNDICYSYSDENSDSDMILKDRVSDIYQNYSICGKECEYELFNDDPAFVNCSCNVKQEISKEVNEGNFKTFLKPFLYSNFGIIKCYKLVFGFKGKLKNIGFWIFGILILFHFPIYFYYCLDKINPIKNYINDEMVKYEYKTPKKDIESLNSSKTIDNFTETNKNKISKKIKKTKAKSKFYKQNNCPPKNNFTYSFYSDNKIRHKNEIQNTSEREINN